jgi:TRAP-type C4-dicarboxylate transport system substrate-binding protein
MLNRLLSPSRATLLIAASLFSASTALADDPIVMKAGSVAPEGTPWADWLDGVRKRLEKDSSGRLKTKVFLSGKLGGEREMIDDAKKGTLQMFGGSIGAVASVHAPELNVFELPFIFESDAEADFVLNALRERTAKILEDKGLVMAMWAENGWHGYGVKGKGRCLTSPDALKGLKMRSQESEIHLNTYKAFGASPVEMPTPEVLAALQTGAVDGYSNTPLFSFATSWYSGIDTFTYSKHIYQPGILLYSKKWFDGLTADLKQILLRREDEASGFKLVRQLTGPLLDNLKAADKQVCTLTPDQTKAFADKARPVWDTFARKSKANKEMLDLVLKAKADFKKK